ncbi:hypothetical protein G6F56_005232 [Rhizopus delemar]|nr:hypothetical protein G6F56_005232 [Rhizopus delemar]
MEITSAESLDQKPSKPSKGSKRNKVTKACNECRKKKVRCDGAPPCGRCRKSGIECNFTNITGKKGPPKEYMEPLEPRLKTVDIVLQTMYKDDKPTLDLEAISLAMDELSLASVSCAPYVLDITSRMDRIPCSQPQIESPQPRLNIKPETPIRYDLIQCYLDYVHPSMPMIDISLLTNTPQSPSLLLSAVYATASIFHPQEQVETPPGWSYYKMALSIIEIYLDTPRTSTVQALLLLIKYHEHIQRPGFFWRTRSLLQLASQMASDLGLAKKTLGFSHETEYQNRTFWALYMYEVLMSTEHGLQPYYLPDEFTTLYPKHHGDAIHFHWLSKVIHAQGFVLQFVRSKFDHQLQNETKEFDSLETRLKYLGQEIPKIMSSDEDINVYYIHLIYHVVNILLYRPYAFSSHNDSDYNFYCQSSASSITDIVEHILNKKGIDVFISTPRGYQQIIYCLTAAVTIQRSAKNMQTCLQSFDLLQYEKTASILKILVEKSPVTEIEDISTESWEMKRKQSSNASSEPSSPPLFFPDSPKITKRQSSLNLRNKPSRLSVPSLYTQHYSHSQPSSPTFNYDMDPYPRRLVKKSSLSSFDRRRQQHPRRHTVTDAYMEMSYPVERHRYSAPPNSLGFTPQSIMIDPSFLMDPVIPDTPSESVMRVLMDTNGEYSPLQ